MEKRAIEAQSEKITRLKEKIGELEAANAALRQEINELRSQENLTNLIEYAVKFSVSAIALTDLKGNLIHVNNSFLYLWGFNSEQQVLGKKFADFWQQKAEFEEILEILQEEEAWVGELIAERSDGSALDAQLSANAVWNEAGDPILIVNSIVDITERKITERALEGRMKELSCLHQIAEISQQPNITLSGIFQDTIKLLPLSWQHSEIAGAAITFSGQFFTTPLFQESPWVQTADILAFDKRVGAVSVSYREKRPKIPGSEGPFLREERWLLNAIATQLGKSVELWQIENALRESEQRYRELVEKLQEGVLVEDAEGIITFANPKATELLGYTEEGLIGKKITLIIPVDELETLRQSQSVENALLSGSYETNLHKKNGEFFSVLINSVPLFTVEQALRGFLSVFMDLSERKRAEEELARADKLAGLGRVTAGVAHELNNPLTFVYANTEVLQEHLELIRNASSILAQLEDAVEKNDIVKAQNTLKALELLEADYGLLKAATKSRIGALHEILDEAREMQEENLEGLERMRKIIGELRRFSRTDGFRSPMKLCNIPDILRITINMLKYEFKDRISLELVLEDLPPVWGREDQLSQAFLNVLTNAADATQGKDGRIELLAGSESETVVIIIQDNGIGIPKEQLTHVFEPFFTTKQPGEGTGLGLAITHSIIQEHQGQVSIESQVGVGTKVKITLPAYQQ